MVDHRDTRQDGFPLNDSKGLANLPNAANGTRQMRCCGGWLEESGKMIPRKGSRLLILYDNLIIVVYRKSERTIQRDLLL
jgi:hypothetical protein